MQCMVVNFDYDFFKHKINDHIYIALNKQIENNSIYASFVERLLASYQKSVKVS